jgi:hypothetical protein
MGAGIFVASPEARDWRVERDRGAGKSFDQA